MNKRTESGFCLEEIGRKRGTKMGRQIQDADDSVTFSLLLERCNISSVRPMGKPLDFSLLFKSCNISPDRLMKAPDGFS